MFFRDHGRRSALRLLLIGAFVTGCTGGPGDSAAPAATAIGAASQAAESASLPSSTAAPLPTATAPAPASTAAASPTWLEPAIPPQPMPVDLALEAMLPKTFLGVPTKRSSGPAYLLTYGFDGCLLVCDHDLAAYAKALGVDQETMTGAVAFPAGHDMILAFAMRSPGVATSRLIPAWVEVRRPGNPEAAYPITVAGKNVTEAYFGPCDVRGTNYLYAVDDVLLIVLDASFKTFGGCENPSAAITDAISQLP